MLMLIMRIRPDRNIRLMLVYDFLNQRMDFLCGVCRRDGQALLHEIDRCAFDLRQFADLALDLRGAVRTVKPLQRKCQRLRMLLCMMRIRSDRNIRLMLVYDLFDQRMNLLCGVCRRDSQALLHEIDRCAFDLRLFADLALNLRGAVRTVKPLQRKNMFHTVPPIIIWLSKCSTVIPKEMRSSLRIPLFKNMLKAQIKDLFHMVICERVIRILPVAAVFDKPRKPQGFELMRDSGFRHAEQRRKVADTHFMLLQRVQNPDAGRIAEELEQRCQRDIGLAVELSALHLSDDILMNDLAVTKRMFHTVPPNHC